MIYTREDFLTAAECEAAISLFPPKHEGAINVEPDRGEIKVKVRRSQVAFLPVDTEERRALSRRLQEALWRANQVQFKFDLDSCEALQLATYDQGGEYDWHLDIGPGEAALRKLSASVQLSDPDDYNGGDLEIWGAPRMLKSRGALVVFPSYMLHRVGPVLSGRRQSLVSWARGKNSFR